MLGQNGTGKSSILNMIGYLLFDYLPGTHKSHIRLEGTTSIEHGRVAIWIVGLNDDLFKIERTIGKRNNTIEVTEVLTNTSLPSINDKISLNEWLQNQFSLGNEYELSTIFQTSVGIPQGSFTEPFLRPPKSRMQFFNPILKVDIYRTAWKKIKVLIDSFANDIDKLSLLVQEKSKDLDEKNLILEDQKKIKEDIEELDKNLKKSETELEDLTNQFENLKKARDDYNQTLLFCKEYEVNISKIKENIELKQKDLENALRSEEICKKTNEDYLIYVDYMKKETSLRANEIKLQETKEKKMTIQNKIGELNVLNDKINREIEEINVSKPKYVSLRENINRLESLNEKLNQLNEKIYIIKAIEEEIEEIKEKNKNISKEYFRLEDELTDYDKIFTKYNNLEKLNTDKIELEYEIVKLNTQIEQLEENEAKSQDGFCPFLDQPCKNVSDDTLTRIFQGGIQELRKILEIKNDKKNQITRDLEEFESVKNKLDKMNIDKKLFENLRDERNNIIELLKEKNDKIKEKNNFLSIITDLNTQKLKLEEDVKNYYIIKEKIENVLPKLEKEKQSNDNQLKTNFNDVKPLDKLIQELSHIPKKINHVKEILDKTREHYEEYQKNIEFSRKVKEIKEEINNYTSELDKFEKKLKKETKKKLSLENIYKEDTFEHLEITLGKKNADIYRLKGIREEKEKIIIKYSEKLDDLRKKEREVEDIKKEINWLQYMINLLTNIRNWYDQALPKITEALLNKVNQLASEIFRDIMDLESVRLKWEKDFNVKLITTQNEKDFNQLSGGEQMAASLAIRLAILKLLTNADFAFFDEPTTNLDDETRNNLAKCIQNIKGFKQIFVISHDDTFEENADNVIKFSKDENEITHVKYLGD